MNIFVHSPARAVMATLVCGATWLGAVAAFGKDQDVKSRALAKELGTVMTQAQLDAIAAQDPQEPDRFVAAMLFPGVQLLVVSARYPSPDYLTWQIQQKQYKEVYSALQQGGQAEGRIFFQDMGADGLPASDDDSPDVLYQQDNRTLFDGEEDEGESEEEYQQRLRKADEEYSPLLQLALDAARAQQALPNAGT